MERLIQDAGLRTVDFGKIRCENHPVTPNGHDQSLDWSDIFSCHVICR